MQKLSMKKQLGVVKLYLMGLPYDGIAAQTGVAKGSVANVVADLRAGRVVEVQDPTEQLELLRELAMDLNKRHTTPGQAVAGITVLRQLQELGVEPTEVGRWAAMCRGLAANEASTPAFVQAALALDEVKTRTGMDVQALAEKARGLEQEVHRLQQLARDLQGCEAQIKETARVRESLAREVAELEKRTVSLRAEVAQREAREKDMARRVLDLDQRSQVADERLAGARRELKALAALGMQPDDLSGLGLRLSALAQRHGIEPGKLRERLWRELEALEDGLGLEALVAQRQAELQAVETALSSAQRDRAALEAAIRSLRQRQAALLATLQGEQDQVRKEIRAISKTAWETVNGLGRDLKAGTDQALHEVRELKEQTLALGMELGRFRGVIEANEWLQDLLVLVKGGDGVTAASVRAIGLAVLRGMLVCLARYQGTGSGLWQLKTKAKALVEELEAWQP